MKNDQFNVLRKINSKPNSSQRKLAWNWALVWVSLIIVQRIKTKGLIKINNFQKNPNKISYAYILTPKGITAKQS